jgi:hypothetical protein
MRGMFKAGTFVARRAWIVALAMAAMVSACGGGGGSGGDDTLTIAFDYGQARKSATYTWSDSGSPTGGATVPGSHFGIVSGNLAPGTSLDASTGEVTGYPSATGTYSAVVQLTVSGYKGSGTSTVMQVVDPIVMTASVWSSVNNLSSVIFQIGDLQSDAGVITEDTPHGLRLDYHLAAGSGPLPRGMTLDASSGQIQGTYGAPVGVYPGIVMEAAVINPDSTHVYTLAPFTLTVTQGCN